MSLQHLRPEVATLKRLLEEFVEEKCIPAEKIYEEHMKKLHGPDRWKMSAVPECIGKLKDEARRLGLWNLFLPVHKHPLPESLRHLGPSISLSVREYGVLCEVMGRSFLASEACNCSAPDTGNMEVLLQFGNKVHEKYLKALLEGSIRSAFLMTEPDVASSDATNISAKLTKIVCTDRHGKKIVRYKLNGRKWWSTGAMDPRCAVAIVMARMDYSHPSCRDLSEVSTMPSRNDKDHRSHTMVVVPMKTKGVRCVRPLTVFGYDDAPHGHAEVVLDNVEVSAEAILLGEGKGFTIAQARLGPGRVHHCMRAVGLAARCYELMLRRSTKRVTFGKPLYCHGGCQEMIADSAADVNMARLMTLCCADTIDSVGPNRARDQIAMIKFAVPEIACRVADRAVQVFGGAGVSDDFPLARALAGFRTLRIADGPDAVHKRTLAKLEIKRSQKMRKVRELCRATTKNSRL